MKLSEWARQQGINYLTAYRWFKSGKLPVAAYQTKSGTIIIETEDKMRGLARVNNGMSVDPLLSTLKTATSLLDMFDSNFSPTYWSDSYKTAVNTSKFKTLNKDNEYIIIGAVPGFTENEIKLSIKDNVLNISGKHELNENDDNYFSKETSSFDVMYTLPHDVDIDNVSADHKNGVLEIKIPKHKNVQIKEIPIKRLKE